MDKQEIERKHALLVNGYEGMVKEARIRYHVGTTIDAIIDELEKVADQIGSLSPGAWQILTNRINELKQLNT